MKFLHLADLHLGKTLGDFDLKDDQRYILQQILEIAETKQVDAVLIAGDVFDKTVPSEGAVQILDEFIPRLFPLFYADERKLFHRWTIYGRSGSAAGA